ncbi:MAG TPA: transaldolase [Candidatus Dormibacteraeota bacterium]|nr:transaldolase [Candidatus Dormibacteraeota bacterium]
MSGDRTPLRQLAREGQSAWCDQLSRQMLRSGQLADLIEGWGITGLTSNPTIFQRALEGGDWYDEPMAAAAARGLNVAAVYETLAVGDIQAVADLLAPVHRATQGRDGHVSLEVSPTLADDPAGSITEARRLWAAVDRPNLMIKIPGTAAGLPAITALLGEGINVNVTLIFGLERYRAVLAAHAEGLARAHAAGRPLAQLASVASFFVSRVDTLVDRWLEARMAAASGPEAERLASLRGRAAIANARAARVAWTEWIGREPMRGLVAQGAQVQRLLWASTSTKNPAYRDVRYVEQLVGAETVNTMPLETIEAFADHGRVLGQTLVDGADDAAATLRELAAVGVDLEAVARELEADGVRAFADSFAGLLQGIAAKVGRAQLGARS